MINIDEPKLTLLQQKILRLLFIKSGKSINAHSIAVSLNVSQPAVSKSLPLLEKQKFITIEKDKESKRLSIELNRDSPKIIGLKRTDNLKQIYESGIITALEYAFPGAIIILFGSYSYGEDTLKSDIDIAIIKAKEKKVRLEEFEKKLEREIRLNFYDNFKGINKNLKSNLFNGIILSGRIEL